MERREHSRSHTVLPAVALLVAILAASCLAADNETPGRGNEEMDQPGTLSSVPADYMPMISGPRFNSNEPAFVTDSDELSRLKFQAPKWLVQFLSFPAPTEVAKRLGRASIKERKNAASALAQIVSPRFLPEDFAVHLIPMVSWAVLYEDWKTHGGADVFITKFQKAHYVLQLAETPSHVIVLVRDLNSKRVEGFEAILKLAQDSAELLFTDSCEPASKRAAGTFQTSLTPRFVYGYFHPRIDPLSGSLQTGDLDATKALSGKDPATGGAGLVRFFSNGDFVAYMILKPLYGKPMPNPFALRFEPVRLQAPSEMPFWQEEAQSARDGVAPGEMRRRQIVEYLGGRAYGADLANSLQSIPPSELEKFFFELSAEQKLAVLERKMIDDYYTSGVQAFASGDYESAMTFLNEALDFDPANPRAAVLLRAAMNKRVESMFGGKLENARGDKPVASAIAALKRQNQLLGARQEEKVQEQVRERAIVNFRTRALDFFGQENYAESLKEWDNLLEIDPGNASALFFKDICEQKLKRAPARK